MNRKAVSPVIATVLLIALVLVLAAIIWLWARAFIPEGIEKAQQPIENMCKEVSFEAEYSNDILSVQNTGNIPIFGIEINKRSGLSVKHIQNFTGMQYSVRAGETTTYPSVGAEVEKDDEIIIIPVLLGEGRGTKEKKAFACEEYSKSIVIQ
jgi:flagellin-like protein